MVQELILFPFQSDNSNRNYYYMCDTYSNDHDNYYHGHCYVNLALDFKLHCPFWDTSCHSRINSGAPRQFLAKQWFSVKWQLLSLCNICVWSRIVDWPINCPQVISAPVLLSRRHLCQEHWLAICQGYYELCLLLVLFFWSLRETSKKHLHHRSFTFCFVVSSEIGFE